jgi:hypothetical protein
MHAALRFIGSAKAATMLSYCRCCSRTKSTQNNVNDAEDDQHQTKALSLLVCLYVKVLMW